MPKTRSSSPLPPPPPSPSSSSRRVGRGLVVAALLGVAIGIGYALYWREPQPPGPFPEEPVSLERTQAPFPLALEPAQVDSLLTEAEGYQIGRADAPVTLYEIVDFQCPACRSVAQHFIPALKKTYLESGKVRLVLIDYPLPIHPQAEIAARAARCAEREGRFEPYQQILFERQDQWGGAGDARALLVAYAEEVGLGSQRFQACLEDASVRAVVEANRALAERIAVPGTPAFVLDGQMLPPRGEAVVAALEDALARLQGPVRGLEP